MGLEKLSEMPSYQRQEVDGYLNRVHGDLLLGSIKKYLWCGSSRTVGHAGQIAFNFMHIQGLITCEDEHLAKDKKRELSLHTGMAAMVSV